MIPALLLIALSLSYFLGIATMLLSAWPWFAGIAFVLVRLRSGRSPLWWADRALETLIDMASDAPVTFAERFRDRAKDRRMAA